MNKTSGLSILLVLACYSTLFAAESSSSTVVSAQSTTQEYNLRRLLLPNMHFSPRIGIEIAQHEYSPQSTYHELKCKEFSFNLCGFRAASLGGFEYSSEYRKSKDYNLDIRLRVRIPKIVRLMTFLHDHGALAANDNFLKISAAALRASYIHTQDVAIEERRIESNAQQPRAHYTYRSSAQPSVLKGFDEIPDSEMVEFFYHQFKRKPLKPLARSSQLQKVVSTDALFADGAPIQQRLQPLLSALHERLGEYAVLLQPGISDWQQAHQELMQDIHNIQEADSSSWEKIAALRMLFYATSDLKRYQNQVSIARTYRPTLPVLWRVWRPGDTESFKKGSSLEVDTYAATNGALPYPFARIVFNAMSTIAGTLAFSDVPKDEFERLLYHVAVENWYVPRRHRVLSVATVENFLWRHAIRILTAKIKEVVPLLGRGFAVDIYRIMEDPEQRTNQKFYSYAQSLLDALPGDELIHVKDAIMQFLGDVNSIDDTEEVIQDYYRKRFEELKRLDCFNAYLALYKGMPADTTLDYREALWHFQHLTREVQKEFLLDMWQTKKEPLEVDTFCTKYVCSDECRSDACPVFVDICRSIIYGTNFDRSWADVHSLSSKEYCAQLLPEMQDELCRVRAEIMHRMYPRYKEILQLLHADEVRGQENQLATREDIIAYAQALDSPRRQEILQQLQQIPTEAACSLDTVEEALPVAIRPYMLLPQHMQQEIMQTFQQANAESAVINQPQPIAQQPAAQRPEGNITQFMQQYGVPVFRHVVLPFLRMYFGSR